MSARRYFVAQSPQPGLVTLAGEVTIGSDGAISAQTDPKVSGAVVTYVEGSEGRYLVTYHKTFRRSLHVGATMVGPDDAAFPTTTGSDPQARLKTTASHVVQFKRVDTQADADPASGTKFSYVAILATK
jgi:hypothetical protein